MATVYRCDNCGSPVGEAGCFVPTCRLSMTFVPPIEDELAIAKAVPAEEWDKVDMPGRELTWTTGKAVEPGWYIFKERPTSWGAFVEITYNGAGDCFVNGNGFTLCTVPDGAWLGPLPEIPT